MASARALTNSVLGQVLPDNVLSSFQEKVWDPNEAMPDLRLRDEFRGPLVPMLEQQGLTLRDETCKHPYTRVDHQLTNLDGVDPPLYLLYLDFRLVDQPTPVNVSAVSQLPLLLPKGARARIFTGTERQPARAFEQMLQSWGEIDVQFVQHRHYLEIPDDDERELWEVLKVPAPAAVPAAPPAHEEPAAVAQGAPSHSIFVSYAHADNEVFQRVRVHLEGLVHSVGVDVWTDKRIEAGEVWHQEIDGALATATCAVLLVSADFLASRFVRESELPQLLAAAESDRFKVFWMKVEPGLVPEKITRFQALHLDPPLGTLGKDELETALEEAMATLSKRLQV